MGVCFCKKVENRGAIFCKKWTFPQRRLHYGMILWYDMVNVNFYSAVITKVSSVQYQFFILHFTYLGVRTHLTHPPAYGPAQYANG